MIIRKLNKNKRGYLKTLVIFILVAIFLIAIFYKYSNLLGQIKFGSNNFSGSNSINILGKIEKIEKLGYSEYILKNNETQIILKNYPQNIDNLIGNNILTNGEIKEMGDNQVFFIKYIKDWDNNILIENNIYTFANELIIFNTKEMPSVVPQKQGNKIIIYYKNNPLIDISTFGCSKISASSNCKQSIDDFDLNENEYFNSYNGLFYYKIDNNRWEAFNDTLLGYYMETKDDDVLLNLSSVIEIINSDYISNNKKEIIINNCKDILNITDISIVGQNGSIIIVDVKGKNQDKKDIQCEVKFDIMNERKIMKN